MSWPVDDDLDDDALNAIAAKVEAERAPPKRPIALLVIRDATAALHRFRFKWAYLDTPEAPVLEAVLDALDELSGRPWGNERPPEAWRLSTESHILHPLWQSTSSDGKYAPEKTHQVARVATAEIPEAPLACGCDMFYNVDGPFSDL